MKTFEKITVRTKVSLPVNRVWELWTDPEHIVYWNSASKDWHTPKAENDLREGGDFCYRMEARDGSMGFNYSGRYDAVIKNKRISYHLGDRRKVSVEFSSLGNETQIVEIFDAENSNPIALQQEGWQEILNNFKAYSESL